jgi:hypothetical protein
MTILEASDYFDEHDIFEFEAVREVTDVKFKLQKKKYVGLDMELFKKIKNKAKRLHKSEDLHLRIDRRLSFAPSQYCCLLRKN